MEITNEYLPSLPARKATINTQINEIKSIIFRNLLEKAEAEATGNTTKVDEADYNNKILKNKIDIFVEELEKLEKEEA